MTDTFERYEKKFLLSPKQNNHMMGILSENLESDAFTISKQSYLIQNIYLDTKDDALIQHSISKPEFKSKLRIRAYGLVTMESMVYIELKMKLNGVVYKRRSAIKLCEAYLFINSKTLPENQPYHNTQVLKEILKFITKHNVVPTTYVSYERYAYKKGDFRVTLDKNILTRQEKLRLEYGPFGIPLLEDGYTILEAKSKAALPLWFVRTLSREKIYMCSFSKVGKDYIRRNSLIKEKGLVSCLNQYSVTHQDQPSQLQMH